MKPVISLSKVFTATVAAGFVLACQAGQGLAAPQADTWWPQWQARLSLQAAPLASTYLPSNGLAQPGLAAQRGVQGGALLGDYYFARPLAAGHFRASGGLMVGTLGGAPLNFAQAASTSTGMAALPRLGLSLLSPSAAPTGMLATENADPVPYLGLGYSGSLWRNSISLTADLGMVSERPAAAGNVGRALFGNQGMNQALRDMRLSPVLQLGMRYTF